MRAECGQRASVQQHAGSSCPFRKREACQDRPGRRSVHCSVECGRQRRRRSGRVLCCRGRVERRGVPYFVPGCPFRTIGARTITLAMTIVIRPYGRPRRRGKVRAGAGTRSLSKKQVVMHVSSTFLGTVLARSVPSERSHLPPRHPKVDETAGERHGRLHHFARRATTR